jgi:hypothetical protein
MLEARAPRGRVFDPSGNPISFEKPVVFATPSRTLATVVALMMGRGRWGWCTHATQRDTVAIGFYMSDAALQAATAADNIGYVYEISEPSHFRALDASLVPGEYVAERVVSLREGPDVVGWQDCRLDPDAFVVTEKWNTFPTRHSPWAGEACRSGGHFQFDPSTGVEWFGRDMTRESGITLA